MSVVDPFDPSRFVRSNTCLPCCTVAPTGCSCALLIPPFGSPYSNYSDAHDIIDGTNTQETVADCLAYAAVGTSISPVNISAFTASDATANELDIDATATVISAGDNPSFYTWASINLLSGETLNVAYNISSDGDITAQGIIVTLYKCDGTLVEAQSKFATPFDPLNYATSGSFNFSIPDDGEYFISVDTFAGGTVGTAFVQNTIVLTNTGAMSTNPVIALWDDSGTTRSLWACPKLLLPPLTESTGDWYADCATADAVLTDGAQVSNCVGFCSGPPGITFTATVGGSISFSVSSGGPPLLGAGPFWASINAASGDVLTASSSDWSSIAMDIYDDTGTVVESIGLSASPISSSALPYTGRYTFRIYGTLSLPVTTLSASLSTSGTLSVNPIQARWDGGLTCPNTLDCGDSCP